MPEKAALPRLQPMLLSSAPQLPPDDHHWAYEVKYDGWRVLVAVDRGRLRVDTRNGHDLTERVPELRDLAFSVRRHRLVLDGELVALDADGRPSFEFLQDRMRGSRGCPLVLMIFDLLHLNHESLVRLPYEERRRRLIGLKLNGPRWQTVSNSVGHGAALLEASRAHGLEGLIAKRLGSKYQPGKRSDDWLKIKNWDEKTFVVGGWVPGDDGGIEALLVGEERDGGLAYVGRVDFGVGRRLVEVLESIRRADSPFFDLDGRRARFVEPRLRAEVRCLAGSPSLRHAVLRRLDVDGPSDHDVPAPPPRRERRESGERRR